MWSASDEAVMAGMAAGDTDAAREFIRRYQRRVFGVAATILGPGPEAEDVAQETFLRVWRNAETFDARRATVSAWVLRIARNAAIDAARLRRTDPVDPEVIARLGPAATTAGPEEAALLSIDVAQVRIALTALCGEQRQALVAAAMLGRTAGEIAAVQGVPVATAKSRIRAGLRRVRDSLADGKALR
jgi:RNA polymerase sigma factor (sigma-70 family)